MPTDAQVTPYQAEVKKFLDGLRTSFLSKDRRSISWAGWSISSATRDVLVRFAARAIDLKPEEVFFRYKGEDRPAGPRWLRDVIRFEDAVDAEASEIHWTVDGKQYDSNSKLTFRSSLPSDLHLFRIWYNARATVCSEELRTALIEAKLSGIEFEKLGGNP